jgi:uncharacterized protein (TIGR02246 family)
VRHVATQDALMSKNEPTEVDRHVEEIRRMRRRWVDVVNAGDAERYSQLMTQDAVWIPPGQPPVQGREAIREWLEPLFSRYKYRFALRGSRVQLAGDWAVERGDFASRLTRKAGGDAQSRRGTYIVLWRQNESGEWRIERYIDDSARF